MSAFLGGVSLGFLVASLLAVIGERCRFGWHDWYNWTWGANGIGQNRNCKKCNFTQTSMFIDKVTGQPVRLTRDEPKAEDSSTRYAVAKDGPLIACD